MKKKKTKGLTILNDNQGMVLMSSLLILSAISLIAVGMSVDTTTDLKTAGNWQIHNKEINLAEGALDIGIAILRDHLEDEIVLIAKDFYPQAGETYSLITGTTMSKFIIDADIDTDIEPNPDKKISEENLADPANEEPDISFYLDQDIGPSANIWIDVDYFDTIRLSGMSTEFAAGYSGGSNTEGGGQVVHLLQITAYAGFDTAVPLKHQTASAIYGKIGISQDRR